MFKIPKYLRRFAVRTLPGVLCLGLAIYMVKPALQLAHYRDAQAITYDGPFAAISHKSVAAMVFQNPKSGPQVIEMLKQSLGAFNEANETYTYWERFHLPQPDQELAALAYFHIGNTLRLMNKPEDAMKAYVESLRLNSGQTLLPGVSARDDDAHQYGKDFCVAPSDKVGMTSPVAGDDCQLARLQKEAEDTRNNILSLLEQHPELKKMLQAPVQMKMGMGKGKSKAIQGDKKRDVPGLVPAPNPDHNDDRRI